MKFEIKKKIFPEIYKKKKKIYNMLAHFSFTSNPLKLKSFSWKKKTDIYYNNERFFQNVSFNLSNPDQFETLPRGNANLLKLKYLVGIQSLITLSRQISESEIEITVPYSKVKLTE